MPEGEAREKLVPVTFKLAESKKKLMDAIRTERGHKKVSETYRAAVDLYLTEYHREKAA